MTRALAPLLERNASYIVTDLNQPMLDRAMRRQPEDDRIEWRQADALRLPFADAVFDVVCCQFGAMFFPDRAEAYRAARRTLRDGGLFIFNVWDRIEDNEFAQSVTSTAATFFPQDPPLFLARTPHGYHDLHQIHCDLRRAGFEDIKIHTLAAHSRAENARQPAIAYCQGTPLFNELAARDPDLIDTITARAAHDIERRFGTGPVSGKIQAHVIVATK